MYITIVRTKGNWTSTKKWNNLIKSISLSFKPADKFFNKISEFVEYYLQINTVENEVAEIDKKTVLDLCAHMFHPKIPLWTIQKSWNLTS